MTPRGGGGAAAPQAGRGGAAAAARPIPRSTTSVNGARQFGHMVFCWALRTPVWKSKFYGALTPPRWRGDAGSSPFDGTSAAAIAEK